MKLERKRIVMKRFIGVLSLSATILLAACSTGTTEDPMIYSTDPMTDPVDSMESIESESVSMLIDAGENFFVLDV